MTESVQVGRDAKIPFAVPDIGEAEIAAVVDTIQSGWLTTGPNAAAFEMEFARFIGDEQIEAVAVNSATAGLHLALEAIGVGPGDEVLVPTWTFTSTAEVVKYLGADPILVDVDPDTYAIDLRAAERALTPRTKAIMPVHFAGLPMSKSGLRDFATDNHLKVVEDAAHAFPARSESAMIGDSDSDAVVFSFYATKTMTTGEGGMVATKNKNLAKRMRTMRLHGIDRDVFDRYNSDKPSWYYEIVSPGFKYNMPDTAAAMGRVQLTRSMEMRSNRLAIAERYLTELDGIDGLRLPAVARPDDHHAWHLFVVEVGESAKLGRDDFIEQMSELGVGTSVHFIPLHLHPFWRDSYDLRDSDFPVATSLFKRVVSLPIFSSMTSSQVDRVISAVRSVLS